jgi:hypothetical protein
MDKKGSRIMCIELYILYDDQFGTSVTWVSSLKSKKANEE